MSRHAASLVPSGWGKRVERYAELAIELEKIVESHPDLELVCEREFTNVCMRYKGLISDENDVNLFNEKIREKMILEGNFMVSLAKIDGKTVLRPVICNPAIDSESLSNFVNEIIRIASSID